MKTKYLQCLFLSRRKVIFQILPCFYLLGSLFSILAFLGVLYFMSFILAKIQRLGKSQILSHFYLQRTGFWFDGVYQPGNLTDIRYFKFQHILTIFFNFFYFYFEVWSRSLTCQSFKFLLELMHLLFCLRILMEVTLMKLNLTIIIKPARWER